MKTYNIKPDFKRPQYVKYVGKPEPIKNYDELEFAMLQVVCDENIYEEDDKRTTQITVRRSGDVNNITNYGIMNYGLKIINLDRLYLTNNTLYLFDSEEDKIQYIREQKLGRICEK